MRMLHKYLASFALLGLLGLGQLTACSSGAEDCALNINCNPDGTPYKGGGEPPPGCSASPKDDAKVISNDCGVFVSASAIAGGDGTKEKPFKTLADGIKKASETSFRVYACAEEYAEAAKLNSVSLFGGFDCADGWTYGSNRAMIAPTDGIAVSVTGGGKLKVEDIIAQGPDYGTAANAGEVAKSSIAALVNGATVEFTRCDLKAGQAQDGADGESPDAAPSLNGANGTDGLHACDGDVGLGTAPGGTATTKACGGVSSVGGKGGDGGVLSSGAPTAAGDGESGQPDLGGGKAGTGEPLSGSWSCVQGVGQPGENGNVGGPGMGATGVGTIDASGYVPAMPASAGTTGTPGQGGGGGGGAKGGTNICGGKSGTGASGGSGGSGGCGGNGGGGGASGGASISLVSVNATVTLSNTNLIAGAGGNGGNGGQGQPGGNPGKGGAAGNAGGGGSKGSCSGGQGGQGGQGGPGGGGAGGPSLGVAYTGTAPAGAPMITLGGKGNGGNDGAGGTANKGADGVAEEMKSF